MQHLILLIFNLILMEKPKQDTIPKSIIKGSGVVYADLNSPKGKGKLLFISPKCTVVGLDNLPYTLFTTPEFSEFNLPPNIQKNIYEVKKFILQPSFITEATIKYCTIPKWLTNFKMIETLRLQYVELDDLYYLEDLHIQHLVLENIKYNDCKKVFDAIKKFRYLKAVTYDRSLSNDLIKLMKELNLKLTIIDEDQNGAELSH
jgi:hypothetical protein